MLDQDLRKHDGVKRLHQSLEEEREAVLDFLYKAIDDVRLTHWRPQGLRQKDWHVMCG